MEIKRKALIINNDRNPGDRDVLLGNIYDVNRFSTFLKTSYGGAWRDDEVVVSAPNIFTKDSLLEYLKEEIEKNGVNFWLIVFTGHGTILDNGAITRGVVQLSPGMLCEVDVIVSALSSCRALLVFDSCRTIQTITEGRAPIPSAIPDFGDTDYRIVCRLLYDDAIRNMPEKTQYIAYSCAEGQEAKSSSSLGSLYLYVLIHVASAKARLANMVRNTQFLSAKPQIFPFIEIHTQTAYEVVNLTKGGQTPEYIGSDALPFVVIPGFIK